MIDMTTVIPATKARNKFFDILNAVIYKGEEFVVEKRGEGNVRIVPERKKPTSEEIDKVLDEFKKVFGKKRPRYWSILETPAWKRKEAKYLENLYKRVNKYNK